MDQNKKSVEISSENQLTFFSEIVKKLQLVWYLLRDNRVSVFAKSVVPASLIYTISPVDFIPDVILGLGQLDDLGVILLGLALFVKLSPPDVVDYYRRKIEYGSAEDPANDGGETVDATYRVVDED